jgi:hypothetical protein
VVEAEQGGWNHWRFDSPEAAGQGLNNLLGRSEGVGPSMFEKPRFTEGEIDFHQGWSR